MDNGVAGIVDAGGKGLITHVDSIAACLWNVGLIADGAELVFVLGCLCHTRRTCREGILSVLIVSLVSGKSALLGRRPPMGTVGLVVGGCQLVIVYNHLIPLPVALTRREHHGSCILEHWHEKGNHDGLGEQVFTSGVEGRALPSPSAFVEVEVAAMRGP